MVRFIRGRSLSSVLVRQVRPGLEVLEERNSPTGFRSIDGVGNNVSNPSWGSTNIDLIRIAPNGYMDRVSTPAGADRPSARVISNTIVAHPEGDIKNDRFLSNFVYAWGQFIDHDLDLTSSASPRESFNIAVPSGDQQFDPNNTGTQIIPLSRSHFDTSTGTSTNNPRQQVNEITSFLDGSMVYGSDATRAAALRTFQGGKLKMDGSLLPANTLGLPNANDTHQTPDNQLFLAGDVRANENIELTSIHTLFVREHNRLANQIAQQNPRLSDEAIYQQARRLVIGEIEAITYNEFLPALLGPTTLAPYSGYKPNVNPGISNEFSTAAFRFGHSMLGNDVEFMDGNGNEIREALELKDALFNPNIVRETNIDPILKYLASDRAEEIDTKVVDSLRNFLFGQPGQGGLDLAALNIQRGRDHGLADYNSTRAAYGLPRVTSFADITRNVTVQNELRALYGDVNHIDLWVGGISEDHIPGGSVGPTFTRIILDQFRRLRDGDRFWYQRDLTGRDLQQVEGTRLSDVIRRNTNLSNVQNNVFIFRASLGGVVFADLNRDGRMNGQERGVGGRTVQLLDQQRLILATTTTGADGRYLFDALDVGSYVVREVVPPGIQLTTPPNRNVAITRGMEVTDIFFGEFKRVAVPPGINRLAPLMSQWMEEQMRKRFPFLT